MHSQILSIVTIFVQNKIATQLNFELYFDQIFDEVSRLSINIDAQKIHEKAVKYLSVAKQPSAINETEFGMQHFESERSEGTRCVELMPALPLVHKSDVVLVSNYASRLELPSIISETGLEMEHCEGAVGGQSDGAKCSELLTANQANDFSLISLVQNVLETKKVDSSPYLMPNNDFQNMKM